MVKTTYIHVDEAGRVTLPPELLKELGIRPGESLALEPTGQGVCLRPSPAKLRRVYIELTNRCNLNCSTCMRNVWDVTFGWLAEQTFDRLLASLQRFSPLPEIFFGGYGEPLSHPRALEMLAKAKGLGFRTALITNGVLLTEKVSRQLLAEGLDKLWVSLDGASPECYQDVRLGNALPGILKNLERLHCLQNDAYGVDSNYRRLQLGIAFVAMQRNIHDLPEVVRLGIQFGATEFSVSNVLAHNAALRAENLYARSIDLVGGRNARRRSPQIHLPRMDLTEQTSSVIVELLKGNHRLDFFGGELDREGARCPFVDRGSVSVRWDGKVSPCLPLLYTHTHYLGDRLRTSREFFVGDLNEQDLYAVWHSPAYLALRERLADFDFSPCSYCNSCDMADQNLEDCYGNVHPTCGACLWAQGLIRCP